MASKTVTLALAVLGIAVLVFLILWFLNTKKTQETEHYYVSPLSTIEHDVSNFVNGVRHGFTNVLGAGKKYLGLFWGLSGKELGNTVGFIEHGISSVEKDAENFVKDVYNTVGLGGIEKGLPKLGREIYGGLETIGKDIYGGLETLEKDIGLSATRPILKEYEKFEKGGANIEKKILSDIKGLEQVGKYTLPPITIATIGKGDIGHVRKIEHVGKYTLPPITVGTIEPHTFVNNVKSLLSFSGVTNACR